MHCHGVAMAPHMIVMTHHVTNTFSHETPPSQSSDCRPQSCHGPPANHTGGHVDSSSAASAWRQTPAAAVNGGGNERRRRRWQRTKKTVAAAATTTNDSHGGGSGRWGGNKSMTTIRGRWAPDSEQRAEMAAAAGMALCGRSCCHGGDGNNGRGATKAWAVLQTQAPGLHGAPAGMRSAVHNNYNQTNHSQIHLFEISFGNINDVKLM